MVPHIPEIDIRAGDADWRPHIGPLYLYPGAQAAFLDIHVDLYDLYHGDTKCHSLMEKHSDYSSRGGKHLCGVPDGLPRSAAIAIKGGSIFWSGNTFQASSRLSFNQ